MEARGPWARMAIYAISFARFRRRKDNMPKMRTLLLFIVLLSAAFSTGCIDDVNRNADRGAVTPPGKLTVKIEPYAPERDRFYVQLSFHNATPKPVSILKPVDGSLVCRHMPYYRFTIRDPDGQKLPINAGCGLSGLWADTRWPQDYLVEIPPGKSYKTQMTVYFLRFKKKGAHTVSFEYVYEPTKERFAPPLQAWRGSLKASDSMLNVPR